MKKRALEFLFTGPLVWEGLKGFKCIVTLASQFAVTSHLLDAFINTPWSSYIYHIPVLLTLGSLDSLATWCYSH